MLSFRLPAAVAVAFAWAIAGGATAADFHVGEASRLIHPAHARNWRGARTQALITRVWYPVDASVPENPHDIGAPGHPVFRGHPVAIDAPLSSATASWPLVLLSHGTGGSADSMDWLGSALAHAGYVVVAVNHPGNTALEPLTKEGFALWWERATDLSDALDAILADPGFGGRIDRRRIGAVGFSLGGYTVLELAGARTAPGALQAFCASPAADAICHPPEMAQAGVDPKAPYKLSPEATESLARAGDSYRDARVRSVFAIAPALGEAFGPASFSEVHIPVAMLAGDADVTAPVDTNIRRIGKLAPAASVTILPGPAHYTFLDDCVPAVVTAIPLLCRDGQGVDRDRAHAAAIERVLAFLTETLR